MVSASAWIVCVLTKSNPVSGDRKSRELMLIPIIKRLTWYYFAISGIWWKIFHQWWQNTLLFNVGYTALLISLFELFYAINYDLRTHVIPPLYFSSMSPAPEWNNGNIALAETTSEAYCRPSSPTAFRAQLTDERSNETLDLRQNLNIMWPSDFSPFLSRLSCWAWNHAGIYICMHTTSQTRIVAAVPNYNGEHAWD